MGFLDKKKNEEWIDGTPESFKIWFWIRLAVCLFLMYTGGELIWRYIKGEVGWGVIIVASIFILFGIIFLVWDVVRFVKLRKALKDRAETEDDSRTTDASSLESEPSLTRTLAGDASGSPERTGTKADSIENNKQSEKPSGISGFAKYVVNDDNDIEEGDDYDEV